MFSVKTNLCTYFFHQILALSRLEGKRFKARNDVLVRPFPLGKRP